MIGWLCGYIRDIQPTHLLLNVNGVGYHIHIPIGVYEHLKEATANQSVELYTHLGISDNAHTLYGFGSAEEKNMFLLLISVSNIGPSSALRVLSALPLGELKKAIQNKEVSRIQQVKGLGKKTADRLVLELSDKMNTMGSSAEGAAATPLGSDAEHAIQALVSLGLSRPEAQKKVYALLQHTTTPLSVESLVKQILQSRS